MKRPDYRHIKIGKVIKEFGVIEIIAMDVVQLDNIRLHIVNILNETPCGSFGAQTMTV